MIAGRKLLTFVLESVPPDQVAMLRSYINIISILGRSVGGPVGGVVTDAVGWRWYQYSASKSYTS